MAITDIFALSGKIINYLNNLGVSYSRGAIIFYNSDKIQYRYHLKRQVQLSWISGFIEELKSKGMESLELGPILSLYCYTLPDNEDITNFVKGEESETVINVPYLLNNSKAEDVIIQFEKEISSEDLQKLVPVSHGLRNPIYHDDEPMEIPVEMAVDYGKEWYDKFESFYIQEIKRSYDVEISGKTFIELLPIGLAERLNEITSSRKLERKDMMLLQDVLQIFNKFQNDKDIKMELRTLVRTDKPKNIYFTDCRAENRQITILDTIRQIESYHSRIEQILNLLCLDIF